MKKLIPLFFVLVVIFGCTPNEEPDLPKVRGADYEYCTGLGYKYESRIENNTHEEYCTFPDGEECIAFDFMTFECGREYSLCSIKGYSPKIGIEMHEGFNVTYAVCLFPDDSYCKEIDFFNRKCHVTW
jgi:putative hemolysin